jgi:MFS transporter, BCD family, chlorophyll transporter
MDHALAPKLGWLSIVRLGLVQTALGGIVVLTTSTINRVMVVELALPAILPGLLVALHFSVQLLRPRWGYNSDRGGRSTPWILAGMATLAMGGFLAAAGTAWMSVNTTAGIVLAACAFLLIGLGAGAAGTSLLVLLAKRVEPARRAAAATIVWVMMIAGFVITSGIAGHFLDPFSYQRLVVVAGCVSVIAFIVAVIAVWGVESDASALPAHDAKPSEKPAFRAALRQVWGEPDARQFTIFVFISMIAYSAQDLILEPFAGEIFRYTPGASTKLSGVQHAGVLVGMILVAITGSLLPAQWCLPLKIWTVVGCTASALSLGLIAVSGMVTLPVSFSVLVFLLGLSNGTFAIAAIGSMMMLASAGGPGREGVRMGLWGAAQAIAFGSGGLIGAASVDLMRLIAPTATGAYATVFLVEGLVFLYAAGLAARIGAPSSVAEPRPTEIGHNMMQPAE